MFFRYVRQPSQGFYVTLFSSEDLLLDIIAYFDSR